MISKFINIVLCAGVIASVACNVYQFNINNTIKSEINTIEADTKTIENKNNTLDKDIETNKNTLSSLSTQIEELNITIESLEADSGINQNSKSTIEISDEDYCYISMLEGMLTAPEYYWIIIDELNTTPENNRFAVVDINSDGIKELLVEYDITSVRDGLFRTVDIYTENLRYNQLGNKLEFYTDGTIVDYDQFRVDYEQYNEFQYITFHKDYDIIANMYIWDKNMPETVIKLVDGEFPEDKDLDHDGKIYVWQDFSKNERGTYDTVEYYLTEKEYHAKMSEMLDGKKKIEIPWQNITRENIANIYPYTLPEDNNLLEERSVIWTYIADQVNNCKYERENDIAGFIECYFSLHHFKDCLQDILPSAEVVYDDTDDIFGYNLSLDDINNIAKHSFQREVPIEDFVSQDMKDIGDNKVQIILDTYGMLPLYHIQIIDTEQDQDQSTQIIKGICNIIESEEESITGYKFNIAIEKNPDSNLDGYEIKACELERVVDEKRIVNF